MISDATDILYGREGGDSQDQSLSVQDIMQPDAAKKKKKKTREAEGCGRPSGMHRELYNLLVNDKKPSGAAPLAPSVTPARLGGYHNSKARLGLRRARAWSLVAFANPARTDDLALAHWRREDQLADPYPFARFNKAVQLPTYTEAEYNAHLTLPNWSREETEHLMDLADRFDLRWLIIHDRWEREKYPHRSVEDLKERFYNLWNTLIKIAGLLELKTPVDEEPMLLKLDVDHERRRKEQLEKLWNRPEELVEEEERLIAEVRKIEARQKERERKAMDLQKLISAADRTPLASPAASAATATAGGPPGTALKKKLPKKETLDAAATSTGLKFPDSKAPGPHIRSAKMKIPQQIGQKKLKAIETGVATLGLEAAPMGTEAIAAEFNGLREDVVLLWELKSALAACEFELEAKRQQIFSATGVDIPIPPHLRVSADPDAPEGLDVNPKRRLTDALHLSTPNMPVRRRKAAMEQTSVLRRLRKS